MPESAYRGWGACWLLAAGVLLGGCAGRDRAASEALATPYEYPFLSPGAKFATLPPAVQNTVRAQAGAADISDIGRYHTGPRTVYVVWFQNPGIYPPLYIAPDGSVLRPDLSVAMGAPAESLAILTGRGESALSLSDLPPQVVREVQRRAPTTEVDTIEKRSRNGQTTYVVSFKDKRYPTLFLAADGKVLESVKH